MKNLAIVCASLSRGGAERVAVYLSKYMVDKKIDTTIVTAVRKENEYIPLEGVKRYCLTDKIKKTNKMFTLYYQIKQMREFLKENDIDTVLIMGVPLCVYAVPACIGTGVKVVVSERNDPRHFAGKSMVKHLSHYLMQKADGYIFQTEEARLFYKKKLGDKGVVIPNPILAENLPEAYEGEREKIIVTAGRLNPQKNQKLLIDAFVEIQKDYPDYKLIIYGEGNLERDLKEYVAYKKMEEKVWFPGNVTNLLERINSATMFVMTSDFEGMPNALIEAMAIGLPCISTDCPCGGPRELIQDGENGRLVSCGNYNELASVMRQILNDESMRNKLSKNALKVKEKLDAKTIGQRWFDYLNKLES